jgi:hypothetical protein
MLSMYFPQILVTGAAPVLTCQRVHKYSRESVEPLPTGEWRRYKRRAACSLERFIKKQFQSVDTEQHTR